MSGIRLMDGTTFCVADYATPNRFTILLAGHTAAEVVATLTEENLSEIRFLTGGGDVTGIYRNQLLQSCTDNGDTLTVCINDADLVRCGLVLGDDGRITSVSAQRYAPEGAVIVDTLPEGNPYDYRYVDGEYVHDPLPRPDPTPEPTVWDELDNAYKEGVNSL